MVDRSFEARERMIAILKHFSAQGIEYYEAESILKMIWIYLQDWSIVFLKLQPYMQFIMAAQSSQKHDPRFLGPWKIIGKVRVEAYKSNTLPEAAINSTFKVSMIRLCLNPSVKQQYPHLDLPADPSTLCPEKKRERELGSLKGDPLLNY